MNTTLYIQIVYLVLGSIVVVYTSWAIAKLNAQGYREVKAPAFIRRILLIHLSPIYGPEIDMPDRIQEVLISHRYRLLTPLSYLLAAIAYVGAVAGTAALTQGSPQASVYAPRPDTVMGMIFIVYAGFLYTMVTQVAFTVRRDPVHAITNVASLIGDYRLSEMDLSFVDRLMFYPTRSRTKLIDVDLAKRLGKLSSAMRHYYSKVTYAGDGLTRQGMVDVGSGLASELNSLKKRILFGEPGLEEEVAVQVRTCLLCLAGDNYSLMRVQAKGRSAAVLSEPVKEHRAFFRIATGVLLLALTGLALTTIRLGTSTTALIFQVVTSTLLVPAIIATLSRGWSSRPQDSTDVKSAENGRDTRAILMKRRLPPPTRPLPRRSR